MLVSLVLFVRVRVRVRVGNYIDSFHIASYFGLDQEKST